MAEGVLGAFTSLRSPLRELLVDGPLGGAQSSPGGERGRKTRSTSLGNAAIHLAGTRDRAKRAPLKSREGLS